MELNIFELQCFKFRKLEIRQDIN